MGGRFNARGTPALYTSLAFDVAYREATQGAGERQPVTLVSYRADVDFVLELGTQEQATSANVDWVAMTDNAWRAQMEKYGQSQSQKIVGELIAAGYAGIIVPSFAPESKPDDRNLVLWRWSNTLPYQLVLIDDENRIGQAVGRAVEPKL